MFVQSFVSQKSHIFTYVFKSPFVDLIIPTLNGSFLYYFRSFVSHVKFICDADDDNDADHDDDGDKYGQCDMLD